MKIGNIISSRFFRAFLKQIKNDKSNKLIIGIVFKMKVKNQTVPEMIDANKWHLIFIFEIVIVEANH